MSKAAIMATTLREAASPFQRSPARRDIHGPAGRPERLRALGPVSEIFAASPALALTGLALAWLYRRRGYWASVTAHATVNIVAAIALVTTSVTS